MEVAVDEVTSQQGPLVGKQEGLAPHLEGAPCRGLRSVNWAQLNADLVILFKRAALGDFAAFEEIYDRTAPILLVRVRQCLNGQTAEDRLFEIYLDAWHNIDRFGGGTKPMAWLSQIALRNCRNDHLRLPRARS